MLSAGFEPPIPAIQRPQTYALVRVATRIRQKHLHLTCVCPCVVVRGEENQLEATQWIIEFVICSTCFGHLYAYHQELETILLVTTFTALHNTCN
jgi:hypothetical protein